MSTASRGDRRIHWETLGEGPPVLLVPGMASGARQFGTLPRRFARAGRTCVVMSPVGIAPSSPHSGPYDFDEAARDVLAVLDAAGIDRTTLAGVSFGGKVGLAAAALAPDRITRLALLGSSIGDSERARYVHRSFEIAATHLGPEDLAAVMAPWLFGRDYFDRHPELVADIVRNMRLDTAARQLMIAQTRAAPTFDGERIARAVTCPVLCIAGAEDTLVPPAAIRATAAALPDSRYVEIPEAGHSLLLESRQAFEMLLELAG